MNDDALAGLHVLKKLSDEIWQSVSAFGDVDAGPRLHSASASRILHASVYLRWVKRNDGSHFMICLNGSVGQKSVFFHLKKNKNLNVCLPGAALGRLLGEGVAYVAVGQKWDMSLNPGGYALVGI